MEVTGPPGAMATDQQAPDLVGSPHDEGEGDYGRELAGGQGRGAEDALQGGQVDQRGGERTAQPGSALATAPARVQECGKKNK